MTVQSRSARRRARFAVFEADLRSGELRKQGRRLRLQGQPFQLLALLLERPGDIVSREEIRAHLWPSDVVVDFDHSLNKAINKLRDALGDSAESPRFIETLPRRGYRFVASVEWEDLEPSESSGATELPLTPSVATFGDAAEPGVAPSVVVAAPARADRRGSGWRIAAGLALVTAVAVGIWQMWRAGATVAPRRPDRVMLVVLPFRNVSDDLSQDYFSDGLTEEMIAQLGRLSPARLGVIAATSAQRYKNTTRSLAAIAAELSVNYVLDGSVRKIGDRVRISGQLVQVGDQTQVWSDTFERSLSDVFEIQTDVAQRIAQALALELLPPRRADLARPLTRSATAHEAFLRGRFAYSQRTRAGLLESISHFERAVADDPAFAMGWVGIADSLNLLAEYGYLAPQEAFPRSLDALRKALALAPDSAEAHANLGWTTYVYLRQPKEAETSFRRAIELNPGYSSTYQWYAGSLRAEGRHAEADAAIARAQELDPVSPIIQAVAGWHEYLARRFDRAIAQCLRVTATSPDFPRVYSYLGWAYLEVGADAKGVASLERALALSGDSPARRAELAHGYAVAGRAEDARRLLEPLLAEATRDYVEPDLVARIYTALGEHDRAFEWLDRSVTEHAAKAIMVGVDPAYDDLRSDPRFADLLRRLGL
ncbi:MAG: winged helix-turn-helix domain-containing protein [Vicinamibacterales bacterium]